MSDFDRNKKNSPPQGPQKPDASQKSSGLNPASSPDLSQQSDSMDLVRKRRERMLNHKPSTTGPKISLSKKIGGIAIIFAFMTIGYWTLKEDHSYLEEADLPVIMAETDINDTGDFKDSPSQEDIIAAPHSDKEFYNELDRSKQPSKAKPDDLRPLPERPSAQISQEALQYEEAQTALAPNGGDTKTEREGQTLGVSSSKTPTSSVTSQDLSVAVVDEPTHTKDVATAQQSTTDSKKALQTPRKTLEMDIRDTNSKRKTAPSLTTQQNNSQKQDLTIPNKHLAIIQDQSAATTDKSHDVQTHQNTSAHNVLSGGKTPKSIKIQKGAYWVQVASLPTAEIAAKEAKRLETKSTGLASMPKRIIRVDLGKPKGIKHRLQYGPLSKTSAVERCQTLKGKDKIGCFVVKG